MQPSRHATPKTNMSSHRSVRPGAFGHLNQRLEARPRLFTPPPRRPSRPARALRPGVCVGAMKKDLLSRTLKVWGPAHASRLYVIGNKVVSRLKNGYTRQSLIIRHQHLAWRLDPPDKGRKPRRARQVDGSPSAGARRPPVTSSSRALTVPSASRLPARWPAPSDLSPEGEEHVSDLSCKWIMI